jgi:hypothetical protein
MLTPDQAHYTKGPLKKHWKKYNRKVVESVNI